MIILTTTSSPREVQEAYFLGASAFITKPVDLENFQNMIQKIVAFWFNCATLTSRTMMNPVVG